MIFLIRHADAVSPEVSPLRPLSQKGRDQVARVCAVLRGRPEFAPAEIWHSPLERSKETAQLLAEGLSLPCPVLLKPGLEPDDDPLRLATLLDSEKRAIAVVGHEPHLGVLATALVYGPAHGIYFPFPKAGVLALNRGEKGWTSEWMVRSP